MKKTILKVIQIALMALNLLSAGFLLCYAYTRRAGAAANILMACSLAVMLLSGLYTVFSRKRYASALLWALAGAFIINWKAEGTGRWIGLAVLPVLSAVWLLLELLDRNSLSRDGGNTRLLRFIAAPLLLLAMLRLALSEYDTLFNHGNPTQDGQLMPLLVITALLFVRFTLRISQERGAEKLLHNLSALVLSVLLAAAGVVPFFTRYVHSMDGIAAAESDFVQAFGLPSAEVKNEAFHQTALSLPDLYFGPPAKDWAAVTNVLYRTVEHGAFAGMNLHYDAYVPAVPEPHKAVIVNLHGSGGDKSEHWYENAHFASLGYVVFDLQVGTEHEEGTGYPEDQARSWDFMLENIDAFFAYAAANRPEGADFDSVFLMGTSMGGFLTMDYVYHYENRLDELGIGLKGIVPYYGGYLEKDDSGALVTQKQLLPALLFQSMNDGTVDPGGLIGLREDYLAAKAPVVGVYVNQGGHVADGTLWARPTQIILYYQERFMEQLR